MPRFYLYILKNNNNELYIGQTIDLRRRLLEHSNGVGAKFTKDSKCCRLVYLEIYRDRKSVMLRENQLKKWSRAKKLALISGDAQELKRLSRSKGK